MQRFSAFVLALMILQILLGCSFEKPIVSPSEAREDERLYGVWRLMTVNRLSELPDEQKKSIKGFNLQFVGVGRLDHYMYKGIPKGIFKVATIAFEKETKEINEGEFVCFIFRYSDYSYLHYIVGSNIDDVLERINKNEVNEVQIYKYEINDEIITIYIPNWDVIKKDIDMGKIHGKKSTDDNYTVTAGGKDLLKYLIKNDKSIYKTSLSFKKIS